VKDQNNIYLQTKQYDFSDLGKLLTEDEVRKNNKIRKTLAILPAAIVTGFEFYTIIFKLLTNTVTSNLFLESALIIVSGLLAGGVLYYFFNPNRDQLVTKRLENFASTNGLRYIQSGYISHLKATFFSYGDKKEIVNELRDYDLNGISVGNYKFLLKSLDERYHKYEYIYFSLPRQVPHLALSSRKNPLTVHIDKLLLTKFDRDQALSLEGDFGNFFKLYVPKKYETDALYIFTPDVMSAFIDNAKEWDVELIGDKVYLYREFDGNFSAAINRQELELKYRLAENIRLQVVEQVFHYSDAKVNDKSKNAIDETGQRLDKSGLI
jgi:hypothetical protein